MRILQRYLVTLKEKCPEHLYNERMSIGVENRIRLYESTLNNAMPIYRWLLSDSSVMDLGEDCTEFSISRAIT